MVLHLVGGFLGSGKTTAIAQASKQIAREGQRVAIVTNDQGRYLVDEAFLDLAESPTVSVGGGCFCCRFDDLAKRLQELAREHQPDVIFAESVGSCADLVATVVHPLLELRPEGVEARSYSCFADSRLLLRRLENKPMPFHEDVVYVYDLQIAEADLLVVNKVDLLSPAARDSLESLATEAYPNKRLLCQNSLDPESVAAWLETLGTIGIGHAEHVDYERYGAGEAMLAWLDANIQLRPEDDPAQILQSIADEIARSRVAIGHVKFALEADGASQKLSWTTVDPGFEAPSDLNARRILVNARIQSEADDLRRAFERALAPWPGRVTSLEVFHPGFPRPTHRIPSRDR